MIFCASSFTPGTFERGMIVRRLTVDFNIREGSMAVVGFHSSRPTQASYTEIWWTYFSAVVHDWYARTLALLTDLGSG